VLNVNRTRQHLKYSRSKRKRRNKYQQQVLDVEMDSFTPLVFGTNSGMETSISVP